MKFIFEPLLKSRHNVICVDGAFEAKLQLSHWHGNSSPHELKADTTTQMAFKLIEHPGKQRFLEGIEIVSNNHYDADGVLSAFVILNPEYSLRHKKDLINIALTGDFAEFTTEDALKANSVIESFTDEEKSIFKDILTRENYPSAMQKIYLKAFEIIPSLISEIDKHEKIWLDEWNSFRESCSSFSTRESVVSNYGDCNLSVVESSFPLHIVSKFANTENDILLSVVKSKLGNAYELEYKFWTWFDTIRPKKFKRRSFETLAQKLNQIETNKTGSWKVVGRDPVSEWNYRLVFAVEDYKPAPSSLKVYEVENILFENLPKSF